MRDILLRRGEGRRILSSSDWTLHWNYSDFQMNSQLLLDSRDITSDLTSQKTRPLPSNECPLLLRIY
jgi:hypothetical protein